MSNQMSLDDAATAVASESAVPEADRSGSHVAPATKHPVDPNDPVTPNEPVLATAN